MKETETLTIYGIIVNAFLFIIKICVGLSSGSLALISDSFNSLMDVLTSSAIYFAVRISNIPSDKDHPFGHCRAQPIAGLLVGVLAGVVAIEIIKEVIMRIIHPEIINISLYVYIVLGISIFLKTILSIVHLKKAKTHNSPALKASGIDSRNDVLISLVAVAGVTGSYYGFFWIEYLVSVLIAGFIAHSAYSITKENIDYLMGKALPKEFNKQVLNKINKIKSLKGTHKILAHYVGNFIHIEIHIEVDKNLSTKKSHDIGEKVTHKIMQLEAVDRVYVHIDGK